MNPQARKIWDALNPKVNTSTSPWRDQFHSDTIFDKIIARLAEQLGNTVPEMPTADQCLAAVSGSHILVLSRCFNPASIEEVEANVPGVGPLRFLEIHPVQFAWVVGRAADAIPRVGAGPADAFIRDAKLYRRPVRA